MQLLEYLEEEYDKDPSKFPFPKELLSEYILDQLRKQKQEQEDREEQRRLQEQGRAQNKNNRQKGNNQQSRGRSKSREKKAKENTRKEGLNQSGINTSSNKVAIKLEKGRNSSKKRAKEFDMEGGGTLTDDQFNLRQS